MEPIWLYWPTVDASFDQSVFLQELAENKGFLVINMENLYNNYKPENLIISEKDKHPNALGHRIMAEALEVYFNEQLIPSMNTNK